jgi:hypothetical protein
MERKKFWKLGVCPSNLPMQEDVLLSVCGCRWRKDYGAVGKADDNNHQCEMHQETYMHA